LFGGRLLIGALAVVAIAGCDPSWSIRADHSLHIVSPASRTTSALPLTVSWTKTAGYTGSYLVVIDRSPPGVGKKVVSLVKDETDCKNEMLSSCTTAAALATRGIYRTTATDIKLTAVPRKSGASTTERMRHVLTIVQLDSSGRRRGDAAWSVDFNVAPQ
jgi:hypothetical protein